MAGKTLIAVLVIFLVLTASGLSQPAESYLVPGRAALFEGTLSGLQTAGDIFDQAAADPDCAADREVLFFHALSRVALWVARDDGGDVGSALELARDNGFDITGDWIRDLVIVAPDIPKNRYDSYDIPADAESRLADLLAFFNDTALPEIDSVLAELDRITDSPEDRFRIYLTPAETAVFIDPLTPPLSYDVEVDYGEVLLLRGVLLCIKANLEAQAAYDTTITPEDQLLEKIYGDTFSVNRDLLDVHPDLGIVLPSSNDPSDGKAALAQARANWLAGLRYALDALDYIRSEDDPAGTDPQDDELLWLDPEDRVTLDNICQRLQTVIDSLENDTPLTLPAQDNKTYAMRTLTGDPLGTLTLAFDILGEPASDDEVEFVFETTPWYILNFEMWDNEIYLDVENPNGTCGWKSGYIWGLLNPDRTEIIEGSFNYWDCGTGTGYDFTAVLTDADEESVTADLNPVFGSSPRYPDPVSPRDLLPEFDAWNYPQPNTVGAGLDNDPTLGGILPDMTQDEWTERGEFQPGAVRTWQEVTSSQKVQDWVAFWTDEQCVFTDRIGDIDEDVPGVDIDRLFLGCDSEYLHGCIVLADAPQAGRRHYFINLSPAPFDNSTANTLYLHLPVYDGIPDSPSLEYRVQEPGCSYWQYLYSFEADLDENLLSFRILLDSIPVPLWGTYLSVDAYGYDGGDEYTEDTNHTRIRLDLYETPNTVSGIVNYPGYIGAPIYIQAFTDLEEPEETLIASTMITEPGPFTLEGIGLGGQCYLRAFTPLFGFDPLDQDALRAQEITTYRQYQQNVSNVTFNLQVPPVLRTWQWVSDSLNSSNDFEDYFAFDAIEGNYYHIELNRQTAQDAWMALHGRNGSDDLVSSYGATQISWDCPVSGRYYVRVYYPDHILPDGAYEIRMTAGIDCPAADISGGQWTGVKDCRVDMYDLSLLAAHWQSACADPYWCDEADYNRDATVDLEDLADLVSEWLQEGGYAE